MTPDPPNRPQKAQDRPKPERVTRADVVGYGNDLLGIFKAQQKDDRRSIEGEIVRAESAERHSSTQTAGELAERRKTERMYQNRITVMLVAAFCLLGYVAWGAVDAFLSYGSAPSGLLFWIALLGAAGFAVAAVLTERLRNDSLRHTPEGLRHVELEQQHEIDLIRTRAEARRYDAGTRLVTAQTRAMLTESQHRPATSTQSGTDGPGRAEPAAVAAPAIDDAERRRQANRRELIHYLMDGRNRDETGRFNGAAPWARRSGKSDSERAEMLELIEELNHATEQPLLIQQKGRGWVLNVEHYANVRSISALFSLTQ